MEIKVFFEDKLKVNAQVRDHVIKTDQSINAGSDDAAPSPFEHFLASLATCSGIYVKQFCSMRNIETDNITITQKHNYNQEKRLIDNIEIDVQLPEDFPEKYKLALVKAIDQCAVKKHLFSPPVIDIKV